MDFSDFMQCRILVSNTTSMKGATEELFVKITCYIKREGLGQLKSVAKISNLQYIEVLQSYGNPIY